MNDINCGLFRQAYNASLDVSKFLDHYRMSKLLKEPYDLEGACVIINAGSGGIYPKVWEITFCFLSLFFVFSYFECLPCSYLASVYINF